MNHKIIAALILLLPAALFSQEPGTRPLGDTTYNSLTKSKLAFQYEGGYNFSQSSVIPIIFSLKYHFSDKTALRFSAGLNGLFAGERGFGFDRRHNNDSMYYNGRFDDHHGNIENLNFTLSYMLYPAPKKEINLFFGLGPRFGIGSQYFKLPGAQTVEADSMHNHKNNSSWSLGLAGTVGAEWFVTRSISLFTEYNVAAGYQKRDYWDLDYNPTTGTTTLNEVNSSRFRFTDLSARLGFSIYFDKPF